MTSQWDPSADQDAVALPSQTGSRRVPWAALPVEVSAQLERLMGHKVVGAVDQSGGFSEGVAARVRLSEGPGVFVKAASSRTGPAAAQHHRRESAITERLPAEAPVPRLLHTYDDGDWVALVFEEIPGHLPEQPWRRDELDRVLSAVTDLADVLTPWTRGGSDFAPPRLGGWGDLADSTARTKLHAFSPWAAEHVDELIELEETTASTRVGVTLQHGDLYPFNIMLTADRVYFVDWPHAWVGAAHCDVLTLLSNTVLSGINPQSIVNDHPLTRDLEPAQIDGMLTAHSGFLLRGAVSAGPAADPNLVTMMAALGLSSLRWLMRRTAIGH